MGNGGFGLSIVLNDFNAAGAAPGPEVAGALLDQARKVKSIGLSADGVTYGPELAGALAELSRSAGALRRFDSAAGLRRREEALAFWINVYNTLVIHGALKSGVVRYMTEVPGFFRRYRYHIGDAVYSLDDIEQGILRQNRGHPMRVFLPQFAPWDRRREFVIRPMDLRIHFALNCGAASCPPIRHYSAQSIDEELELAARSFVAGGGVAIDPADGVVRLSRILLWHSRDFGLTKRRQLEHVMRYVDTDERGKIEAASARRGIGYAAYDWTFA